MKPIKAWMVVDKSGNPISQQTGDLWVGKDKKELLACINRPAGQRVIPVEIRERPKGGSR